MYILRKTPIVLIMIVMVVTAQAGCSSAAAANTPPGTARAPWVGTVESKTDADVATPITVKLILSKAPHLNEEAELTFIISSIVDAPNTIANLVLPEGAVLTSGSPAWSGAVKANQPQVINGRIMFTTEGNKTLEARAYYDVGTDARWGDAAYIYLQVTKEAGYVGFPPSLTHIVPGQQAGTPPAVVPQP